MPRTFPSGFHNTHMATGQRSQFTEENTRPREKSCARGQGFKPSQPPEPLLQPPILSYPHPFLQCPQESWPFSSPWPEGVNDNNKTVITVIMIADTH